jgi:hypothetical protein
MQAVVTQWLQDMVVIMDMQEQTQEVLMLEEQMLEVQIAVLQKEVLTQAHETIIEVQQQEMKELLPTIKEVLLQEILKQ